MHREILLLPESDAFCYSYFSLCREPVFALISYYFVIKYLNDKAIII